MAVGTCSANLTYIGSVNGLAGTGMGTSSSGEPASDLTVNWLSFRLDLLPLS